MFRETDISAGEEPPADPSGDVRPPFTQVLLSLRSLLRVKQHEPLP